MTTEISDTKRTAIYLCLTNFGFYFPTNPLNFVLSDIARVIKSGLLAFLAFLMLPN
jgi:hypothetical protein